MKSVNIFNGELARAARALVGVNAQYVANEAGLTLDQLRNFEKGLHELTDPEQERVEHALSHLGAVFLPDGPDGGYGVRLRFARGKINSIGRWEGEGGPTAEDDV
ncbi:MAG: XRE family transcriptional regulator [Micrococcaceae bacterium]